jgi:small-conductance mechanosensitive channel
MKILVMIALVVAVLACAGSLYFINQLGTQKSGLITDKTNLTKNLNDTTASLNKTKADLDATNTQLTNTKTELSQTSDKLAATRIELDQKKQEAEQLNEKIVGLEKNIKDKDTELAAVNETLAKLKEVVGQVNAEDIGKIKEQVETLGKENKLMSEQLVVYRGENQQLKQRVEELSVTPVGLRGKVAMVNDSWNFLVLDIGRAERVQTNTTFLVYRDTKMIGKVNVVSVGQNTSVAELLPDFKRGAPRAGDIVVH